MGRDDFYGLRTKWQTLVNKMKIIYKSSGGRDASFGSMWKQDIDNVMEKRKSTWMYMEGSGKFKPRGDWMHNFMEEVEENGSTFSKEIPWKYGKVGIGQWFPKRHQWYWNLTNRMIFLYWKLLKKLPNSLRVYF